MPDGIESGTQRASAAPGVSGADTAMAPPAGTPSSEEQTRRGEVEQARASMHIAMTMMERALPMLGSDSDEGKTVLKALMSLSQKFAGKKSEDLTAAEHIQTMAGMSDHIRSQITKELGAGAGSPQLGA